MQIQEEDPGVEDVHTLLLEHLADIRTHSPLHSKCDVSYLFKKCQKFNVLYRAYAVVFD